jgi:polyisoprenoid-binding protein YceI
MKTAVRILLAAALAVPAAGLADTWSIDASHSRAGFSIRHLVISDVKGEFSKLSGKASIDEKDLSRSSVEATIEAASVDTRDEKRDNHLRSADFFDVARCPTIAFKSTKVEPGADGKLKIAGDLTLRCTTKPVVLDGELSQEIKDPWGNARRGFSATAKINRKDFGVSWSKVTDVGAVAGDEVKIDVQAEIVKEPPKK